MNGMSIMRSSGRLLNAISALFLLTATSLHAQEAARAGVPDADARWHWYVHDLTGPGAWLGIGASVGYGQITSTPPEWSNNGAGFAKRLASGAGQLFVQETVHHGFAAALDHSTQYEKCHCEGAGRRIAHAFSATFHERDASGDQTFAITRVGGVFSGAFSTLAWMPHTSVGTAALNGAVGLGLSVGGNIVRELLAH